MSSMYKLVFFACAAFVLGACAAHPAQSGHETLSQALFRSNGITGVQSGSTGPVLICSNTPTLGSHIADVHCVTPEQAAAERKATQAALQQMHDLPCTATKPGGPTCL